MENHTENSAVERPPVIAIVGHVDHGKSTLLDYIRKTNVVAGEAGGITQLLSAYEVIRKNDKGAEKRITFLDTPGHEAFSGMRGRGVEAADIAVLLVSAEDGVKAQTLEALESIKAAGAPFIVAINKIDKPAANPEKVKADLAEREVYVEGFGGNVPCVLISAKTGAGVPELLDMLLLVAELEELKGDRGKPAEGLVIESHLDQKRGLTATLLIKDGSLRKGAFVVSGDAIAPARRIEDFSGQSVEEATFSSPVTIAGFNKLPGIGACFETFSTKKEAEAAAELLVKDRTVSDEAALSEGMVLVPIIIKADVAGQLEALEKELSKLKPEGVIPKIAQKGVGAVSESDVKLADSLKGAVVVAFGVKVDKTAADLAERLGVRINSFDVIYKLTEWLAQELAGRKIKVAVEETSGTAKVLKCFSRVKDKQIVGGRVQTGSIVSGGKVKIIRRDFELGRGEIMELQQHKSKVGEVPEGNEFGVMIESKTEIAPGDEIEVYRTVIR